MKNKEISQRISKKELSKKMFSKFSDNYFFKKHKKFKEEFKDKITLVYNYELCYLSRSYAKDLIGSCFEKKAYIFNRFINDFEEHIVLYGLKATGKEYFHSFYEKEIAPFYVYPIFYEDTNYFTLRFTAYSIDDSSYGFFLHLNSKEEKENALVEIRNWLSSFEELPSASDFETYWKSIYEQIDFDYN